MSNLQEIWKDIEGYEGLYQVSNLGRFKALPRKRKTKNGSYNCLLPEQILNPTFKTRYYQISLTKSERKTQHLCHRLVAKAFNANPYNKPHINHKNGDTKDNRSINLEWCTPSENQIHRLEVLGKKNKPYFTTEISKKIHCIWIEVYDLNGNFLCKHYSAKDFAEKHNLSSGCITKVLKGEQPYHKGFVFKYAS